MFESWDRLLLGLVTGVLFGVLLQKGRVAKFRVIVAQFLLKDFTVLKIMGTAVIVGGIGIQLLHQWGVVSLHIKPLLLGGVLIGGVLFGIGMAVLGYCPGTGVAACGEGRRDAIAGVLGMLTGAGLFVAGYPWLQPIMRLGGHYGELRVSDSTVTSPWLWYGALLMVGLIVYAVSRTVKHRRRQPESQEPPAHHHKEPRTSTQPMT